MGCAASVAIGRKKRKNIPLVSIFVPPMRVPVQSDLQRTLKGLIPKDLADRIGSLRNQIVLVAEDTGGSAIPELHRALEEYLSLLLGLTKNEHGLQELVEFKWKNLDGGRQVRISISSLLHLHYYFLANQGLGNQICKFDEQEVCIANSLFELLSVVHMMALLTLNEANSMLIPEDYSNSCERAVSADNMRNAVDLLLKAAGYLDFSVRDVLVRLPPHIKTCLPNDLHEGVLEATYIQALGN